MDKDELWNNTLSFILDESNQDEIKSVFLNLLTPFDEFDGYFFLIAENAQVESWVNKNYLPDIERALTHVSGIPFKARVRANIQSSQQNSIQNPKIDEAFASAPSRQFQRPESISSYSSPVQPTATNLPPSAAPDFLDIPSADTQIYEQQPEWMNTYVSRSDLPYVHHAQTDSTTSPTQHTKHSNKSKYSISREDKALFLKCTFETFVVGKSNEFARGAALAVAEQPGIAYNPLFIYGNSGLGKTHLLVAIANYALQNLPYLKTVYISANKFLNDYVAATQRNEWQSFNEKYHQADFLLLDDVQYLVGREETINQFFNIFNEMINQNKQIVLSADRAPKDIDMDERMRSRFVSGLLADIKAPDYETRLAILKNYLARVEESTPLFATVPDDVLSYLASASSSNIREMEGAINRLVGYITLGKRSTITLEQTQDILRDYFPDTANKQIRISTIQSEVEHYFNISHEDMVSSKRNKEITTPRHIAIYLSRYLTEESLENIGKRFGGRDHTTIMHSVNKVEKEQKDNRLLFDQIDKLMTRIKERS